MTRLGFALDQIDVTRRYTRLVLDHCDPAVWYEMPPGCPSHIAWQVGHIAWAEASHAWRNVLGREVNQIIPAGYGEMFGKGSAPVADAGRYPSPHDLIVTLDAVHAEALAALGDVDDELLSQPASHATGLIRTKFDLLTWIARHEMLHVGQIGMLRRLLGLPPYR